jgi:hypothetical protein
MTPKEKAKELVGKYSTVLSIQLSKEFALIAVNEIMDAPNTKRNYSYMELITEDAPDTSWFWNEFDDFWNDVKDEIEKL